jgi:Tol biopolymer transport system component
VPSLELVSRSSAGVQGASSSGGAALSANGRFVAFHSLSANLVAGDTNANWDVFVNDRLTGATERVSIDSSGLQAEGSSAYPSISADGRLVAFHSHATNLVAGDVNGTWDVFVHDRSSGETRLASRNFAGAPGNGRSEFPALSADGRTVAFQSFATDLANDPNGNLVRDVFVHDLWSGETTLVSVGYPGNQGADRYSEAAAISGDGRLVAFHSSATNLVPGDTNGSIDVFLRDRLAGTTTRVSVDPAGAPGDGYGYQPAISRDGRFVAFVSGAALVPGDDDGGLSDVYVRDLATGETLGITATDPTFALNTAITHPSISDDGLRVAFQAVVENYPFFETSHVFLHDRARGITTALSRRFGEPGDGDSFGPSISASGRVIGFESRATNLVPGDANGTADVLVHLTGG